jgi:hypothetical protein
VGVDRPARHPSGVGIVHHAAGDPALSRGVLAAQFPSEHQHSIRSTDALERVNAEIDRRTKVVGMFPNSASLPRLSTPVLQEQHDEGKDGRCHFSQQSMARAGPGRRSPADQPPYCWVSGLLNLSPSSARFYTNRWDLTWNTRTSPLRGWGGGPRRR